MVMRSATEALMRIPCVIDHVVADGPPDEYGNVTTTRTTTTTRCWMAQQRRNEVGFGPVETETWSIYLPGDTLLDAGDTVTVGANTYEVVGEPWPAVFPLTNKVNHLEGTMERRR